MGQALKVVWGLVKAAFWRIPATVCKAIAFVLVMIATWVTDGYEWCDNKARRAKET